ncbi:MAG TPA: hypothetical protein ENI05_06075 [Porticoccus sp.]|nr:hypothetical protein [Porticoccus sp.]
MIIASQQQFISSVFGILDSTDPTKIIDFDASAIGTGTSKTITMPDADVDLTRLTAAAGTAEANKALVVDGSKNIAGIGTFSSTGDITWLGASIANWGDAAKTINIRNSETVAFRFVADGQPIISINTTPTPSLNFGSAAKNPAFNFLGSGLTTLGGNLLVNGSIAQADNLLHTFGTTNTDMQISSDGTNGIIDVQTALRIGNIITNFSKFEDDGTLEFNGTATVFEDIVISLSSARVPAANAPTWAGFIGNLNNYTYGLNDFQEFSTEIKHSYKEGSDIEFHLHGATNGLEGVDKTIKFEIEYELINPSTINGLGGVYTGTTIMNGEMIIPASTADKTSFVLNIGIENSGNFNQGASVVGRVRRIASTGTEPASDPFVVQVGIHVEQDTVGSRTELTK